MCDISQFLCMLPMAMARSSSGRVTKSQGEAAVLGVFFTIDNALYSIAFGTHTKTAEPIEMPFGMMSGLYPRNSVTLGDDLRRGRGNFGGTKGADKPNIPMNCELDWCM